METGKSAVQFPQEAGHGLRVGVWSIDITCDLATNSCFASGLNVDHVKRQVLACDGFASPADDIISLPHKANRVISLNITLRDWWTGDPATDGRCDW